MSESGRNPTTIWVLLRTWGWGFKGHPHASIMTRPMTLIGLKPTQSTFKALQVKHCHYNHKSMSTQMAAKQIPIRDQGLQFTEEINYLQQVLGDWHLNQQFSRLKF